MVCEGREEGGGSKENERGKRRGRRGRREGGKRGREEREEVTKMNVKGGMKKSSTGR